MKTFDETFENKYREHVFLEHDLVPIEVKMSLSPVYLIDSPGSQRKESVQKDVIKLEVKSDVKESELRHWFMGNTSLYSVLRFHSLYINLNQSERVREFKQKLLNALVVSDFKQLRKKSLLTVFNVSGD
jgi:hypothetical protein